GLHWPQGVMAPTGSRPMVSPSATGYSPLRMWKRVQNQLASLARIDKLTGLLNRNHLYDRLTEAISRNRHNNTKLVVAFTFTLTLTILSRSTIRWVVQVATNY
ncbi:MAG: GGDEF domain-containing protein, partial [Oxalobacteraceae bacterium]